MCPRRDPAAGAGGFALVESLVALGLLGLVAVLLLQGLAASQGLGRRVAAGAETAEAIEGAQAVLRQRLARAFPATRYDAEEPYPEFEGAADRLDFIAPAPQADGLVGRRYYRLGLGPSGALTLRSWQDVWAARQAPPREDILLRGLARLDLAYFDGAGQWRSQWHQRPGLPALIRLRVRFPPGDRRWWPDLLVHPMANIDADCALDGATGRCEGR